MVCSLFFYLSKASLLGTSSLSLSKVMAWSAFFLFMVFLFVVWLLPPYAGWFLFVWFLPPHAGWFASPKLSLRETRSLPSRKSWLGQRFFLFMVFLFVVWSLPLYAGWFASPKSSLRGTRSLASLKVMA